MKLKIMLQIYDLFLCTIFSFFFLNIVLFFIIYQKMFSFGLNWPFNLSYTLTLKGSIYITVQSVTAHDHSKQKYIS